MSTLKSQHATAVLDVAWEHDMLPIRQALMTYGPKWWKFMSGTYRQAKGQLQALSTTSLPKTPAEMLKVVDAVIEYQVARKDYDQHETLGSALYGAQWQRQQSDWEVLERITDWVMSLHDDLGRGEIPSGIIGFLSGNSDASGLGDLAVQIETSITQMKDHLETAVKSTGMSNAQDAFQLKTASLDTLSEVLDDWIGDISLLYPMVRFNGIANKLKSEGLGPIADVAASADNPALILASYDQTWYTGLVQQVYSKNPTLQQFDPDEVTGLTKPYIKARLSRIPGPGIIETRTEVLINLIQQVLHAEGAIHISEVTKRLMEAFGVSRTGSRIAAKVDEAVKACHRQAVAVLRGDFVYPPGNEPIQIRDRSALDSSERKIEFVPPEEIDLALQESIRLGFSMPIDDAVPSVLGLLGFGRATQRIAGVIEERLEQLVKSNILSRKDGILTLTVEAESAAFK